MRRVVMPGAEVNGNTLTVPIDQFSENGYNWTRVFIFKRKVHVVPLTDDIAEAAYIESWADPTYEVLRGIETGHTEPGGRYVICDCDDCIKGRELVARGWKPR